MSVLAVLAVLALVNVAFVLGMHLFALKGLVCARSVSSPAAFEGESVEVVEVVRNDRPLLIPWLRLESRISPHLRFGRQENLGVSGSMYHRSLFMLMPYQQITRRHRVYLARRGAYNIGNASLTVGDLLGLITLNEERAISTPVLVYPRLLDADQLPAPLYRLLGEISVQRQLLRDPFWVNGIRPYQPQDNVRDIHWAATARTGELQVRTHDFTAQARLMVVVNGQLTHHQWGPLMEYEQGPVEYAISCAATLCVEALRQGIPCGFASSLPSDANGVECTLLPPAANAAREEELLAAMARLQIRFVKSFHEFLDDLLVLENVDFLILSAYESDEIHQRLAQLRQRGNTVRLCLFSPGEVEACAHTA